MQTLNDWLLGQFKGTLLVLFAAVALLLLIGCGNVSILMLARGTCAAAGVGHPPRYRRIARLRIVRQLLTESVILALSGGILGMAFAYGAIHLIVGLLPEYSIPHEVVIRLNVPVLLFSTAVSVAVGSLPASPRRLQFSSPHISQMVQSSGTRSTTSHGARTRTALIAAQIALTVLMLAGAGAAMRNFVQAYGARLGFDPHGILCSISRFLKKHHHLASWGDLSRWLLEKIRATPGVLSAAGRFRRVCPRMTLAATGRNRRKPDRRGMPEQRGYGERRFVLCICTFR